jgi:hypothetical protein
MRYMGIFLFAFTLLGALIQTSSCRKKEDRKGCFGYITRNGTFVINQEEKIFVYASYGVFEEVPFNRSSNFFSFEGKDDDCNISHAINITIQTEPGAILGGSYPIKTVAETSNGDAYGSYNIGNKEQASTHSRNITSGTLLLSKEGENTYQLEIDAELGDASILNWRVRHTFE